MSNKKEVCLIFILALAVRAAFVLFFPSLFAADTGQYDDIACSLLKGDGFSISGIPTAGRPPLYPLFLAGVYSLFGQSHLAVKLVQAILGAISCIIVYLIAKESFNHKVGLWSGIAMTLYPPLISTAGFVLSEELTIILLAISTLFLIRAIKREAVSYYILTGIFLGLTTLCRSITLLFPIFLYLTLLFSSSKRRGFVLISMLLVSMILTVAPWTIRNYIKFNAFIPCQTDRGVNIWVGTHLPLDGPGGMPYGVGSAQDEYKYSRDGEAFLKVSRGLSPIEADKAYYREGIKNILNNPSGYLLLCVEKFKRYWFWIPGGVEVLKPYPKIKLGIYIVYYFVLLLAVFGVWTGLKKDWRDKLPILAIILYFTITHTLIFAVPRFHIPVMPYDLIFAVAGFLKFLQTLGVRCK
ncbi:MAG: glycosyltransferase family 39 protein [bacterium]|nr:glycosyltransferase family 39 protein [bacterium]